MKSLKKTNTEVLEFSLLTVGESSQITGGGWIAKAIGWLLAANADAQKQLHQSQVAGYLPAGAGV